MGHLDVVEASTLNLLSGRVVKLKVKTLLLKTSVFNVCKQIKDSSCDLGSTLL